MVWAFRLEDSPSGHSLQVLAEAAPGFLLLSLTRNALCFALFKFIYQAMNLKLWWLVPVAAIIGLIIWNWNWGVSETNVVGTYVNANYDKPNCCVEAPHQPDSLDLFPDGTMKSGFYGKGTWKLVGASKLELYYNYEYGGAVYQTVVENHFGEEIRLDLNYKTNHYYRKIR